MPITELPPAPSRSQPSTFSNKADALLGALSQFVTEANALETNVNSKEADAETHATNAGTYADLAEAAKDTALAAANYVGEWSAQTGAANVPYAVSHNDRFWQLTVNLANVTTKEPGVAPEWLAISPLIVTETQFLPIEWAEDGVTATADGAEKITSGNGRLRVRQFSGTVTQDVLFPWKVPNDLVVSDGIKFAVGCLVTNATGPSSEGVVFRLSGFSVGDGDAINGTFGAAVVSSETGMTHAQYDTFETGLSDKVTITALAQGELAFLKLDRQYDHASDTYGQKIGAYGITIQYSRLLG